MSLKHKVKKAGQSVLSIFKREKVDEYGIPVSAREALERIKKHSPRDYKIIMKKLHKEFSS